MPTQVFQTSQRGNILAIDTIYFEIDRPNTQSFHRKKYKTINFTNNKNK